MLITAETLRYILSISLVGNLFCILTHRKIIAQLFLMKMMLYYADHCPGF